MSGLLRAAATRVFGLLPHFVADRVHPLRRRLYREVGVTTAAQPPRRLLIGPVNSAGQAYAWARAASRSPGVAAKNVMHRSEADPFGFPADHSVPAAFAVGCRRWQRSQRAAILASFTHVLLESGQRLFDSDRSTLDHIRDLQNHGIRLALLFHGSDIRLPSRHAKEHPSDTPFQNLADPETAALEDVAARNAELVMAAGVPVFVSTPDLMPQVRGAVWLPVVVDAASWESAASAPPLTRSRPVVVHAPSRAGLKGSAEIAQTVSKLHSEGVIEYREAHGVASVDMPAFYGAADVVLDQFSLGIYGVAACEAMASGRLVVSHVDREVRASVERITGARLPIVESRASGLEDVLRAIAQRPEEFRECAARGRSFVEDVHDGRRSARALEEFLRS